MFASSLNVAEVEQFFTQEEGKLLSEPRSKCRLCIFFCAPACEQYCHTPKVGHFDEKPAFSSKIYLRIRYYSPLSHTNHRVVCLCRLQSWL
jgi:hypothetical protein